MLEKIYKIIQKFCQKHSNTVSSEGKKKFNEICHLSKNLKKWI